MGKTRCYLAGPISQGDLLTNIQQADEAFAALLKIGVAPWCPHWSVYHGSARHETVVTFGEMFGTRKETKEVFATAAVLPGETTHDDWMVVDLAWVEVAHCLLRLPGTSEGADREVALAESLGIPVFNTVDEVRRFDMQNSQPEDFEL